MSRDQYVNLMRKADLADGVAEEQLGPVTLELFFETADAIGYKVRVTEDGTNAKYSQKEKGRNRNFKVRRTTTGVSDATHVLLDTSVHLPAAGGNEYEIEAKDGKGNVAAAAVKVIAKRRVYYQIVCMSGLDAAATAGIATAATDNATIYENAGKKYFIDLKKGAGNGTMKHYRNIKSDDWSGDASRTEMFQEAAKGYSIAKYEPWAFVLVACNHITSYKDDKYEMNVSLAGRLFRWGNEEIVMTLPPNKYLWKGLDDFDDALNGGDGIWFISAEFNEGPGKSLPVSPANVSLGPSGTGANGEPIYGKIKIKLDKAMRNTFTSRKGSLKVTFNRVAGFTGGYNDPAANFITVATESWWQPKTPDEITQTLSHEAGHVLGMTADGSGRLPAAPPTLYGNVESGLNENSKSHQGPHCEKGASYDKPNKQWSGSPECVMFGSSGTSTARTPSTYCSNCEKIVRKLDLDARVLSNFSTSITTF